LRRDDVAHTRPRVAFNVIRKKQIDIDREGVPVVRWDDKGYRRGVTQFAECRPN